VWTEPILHVDMDSFYVEVERLADPSLRSVPVAVGGTGPRGVIASASYEARKYGVHSAQPTAQAMRACPQLKVVLPSHHKYGEVSAGVFAVFRSFTPLVEGLSLDEAFLDVSGLRLHYDSPVAVGEDIRSEIRSRLGLPSSVGVASNKLIAKLASESAKPDGILHVPLDAQAAFLDVLPATSLPGVGPATLAALRRLGVATVADIAAVPEQTLAMALGPTLGHQLLELARGNDPRGVEPDLEAKSISVEETYPTDLEGPNMVTTALLEHAHRLSARLRRSGVTARTISLKVRYPDFETVTRTRTSTQPTHAWRDLFRVGGELLADLAPDRPVRLLGLGASGLERDDQPRQVELGSSSPDWDRVEDVVFEVRGRFGDTAISPARSLEDSG
jgi:DNA polymerase IV